MGACGGRVLVVIGRGSVGFEPRAGDFLLALVPSWGEGKGQREGVVGRDGEGRETLPSSERQSHACHSGPTAARGAGQGAGLGLVDCES